MAGPRRAQANTLTIYNNLQYDPIEIADFCIVEVYKDKVAKINSLGYLIQPLTGVTDVKATIEERVRESAATGYENLVILAGRDFDSYSRKRVYAVWYNGDEIPQYPSLPEQHDLGAASDPFDFFQDCVVNNPGAPTNCRLTLTLSALDKPVEFYVNDDYFKIDVSAQVPTPEKVLVVDKAGVKYNNVPINTFEFLSVPKLKAGSNTIRASKIMIANVQVDYVHKI